MAQSSPVRSGIQPIRVLFVEDSAVIAQRLIEALSQLPDFQIVGVVDGEAQAILAIKRGGVDIVLLDLQLRQGSGFGVLRALANMARKPLVIVLTNHDLPEYHTAALGLGVTEFMDKARALHRLPAVLHESQHSLRTD